MSVTDLANDCFNAFDNVLVDDASVIVYLDKATLKLTPLNDQAFTLSVETTGEGHKQRMLKELHGEVFDSVEDLDNCLFNILTN